MRLRQPSMTALLTHAGNVSFFPFHTAMTTDDVTKSQHSGNNYM